MSTELKYTIDNLSWDAYNYYKKNVLPNSEAYVVEKDPYSDEYAVYYHSYPEKKIFFP